MTPALSDLLNIAGVEADGVAPLLGDGDAQVLYAELPGDVALAAWWALHEQLPAIGYSAAILGDSDMLRCLQETYAANLATHTPATALAASRPLEPIGWMIEQYKRDAEFIDAFVAESEDGAWPPAPTHTNAKPRAPFDVTGRSLQRCALGLFPTPNPLDIPAYLLFGGFNACHEPPVHCALLRYWHERCAIEPMGVTHAMIEVVVHKPAASQDAAMDLAREHLLYCPDVIEQGAGTFIGRAVELWQAPLWTFWWD